MKQQLVYLDAGTGSLIVSAIVAGAAGVGVLLRLGWRRIVGFFSPRQRAEQAEAQDRPVPASTGASAEPRD